MKKILVTGGAGYIGSHLCETHSVVEYIENIEKKYSSHND